MLMLFEFILTTFLFVCFCSFKMMQMAKRTSISDYKKINKAEDLDRIVQDKRINKRANKQKQKQRNRRYEKRLLRNLQQYGTEEE